VLNGRGRDALLAPTVTRRLVYAGLEAGASGFLLSA
jgi:hypothetical protein